MFGQFDLITLIALIIAIAAIVKLRSVLGHRTDEDEKRVERLRVREREAGQRPAAESASADVITLPRRDPTPAMPAAEATAAGAEARIRAYPTADAGLTDGLLEIARLDPAFDPEAFLSGANRAYEMIVSAFAEGNRRLLRDLLSKDVLDGFSAAIAEREAREETLDQQFVGIKKSEIVGAEVKSGVAQVTVRFLSELISATRNKAGDVIDGDAQRIKDVTDIWTFSRDISTERARSNLNWRLIETQAPA